MKRLVLCLALFVLGVLAALTWRLAPGLLQNFGIAQSRLKIEGEVFQMGKGPLENSDPRSVLSFLGHFHALHQHALRLPQLPEARQRHRLGHM